MRISKAFEALSDQHQAIIEIAWGENMLNAYAGTETLNPVAGAADHSGAALRSAASARAAAPVAHAPLPYPPNIFRHPLFQKRADSGEPPEIM
jgi:hypothetical protein